MKFFAVAAVAVSAFLLTGTEAKVDNKLVRASKHRQEAHRLDARDDWQVDFVKRAVEQNSLLSNITSNLTSSDAKDYDKKMSQKDSKAVTSVRAPMGLLYVGGQATWYKQDNTVGACGVKHGDQDKVVALEIARYGFTGEPNANCGRTILIVNTNTGAWSNAVVADACPGCVNYNSLDLSTGLFNALANPDDGVFPIAWTYVSP